MKIFNIKVLVVLACILVLNACTDQFDEINKNPNYPTATEANPALILPKILFETGNHVTSSLAWGTGNVLAQLVATNNFTGTDRYLLGSFGGTWNLMYRNLRDAQNLQAIGEATNNNAYQGTALILKSWMIAQLTELYGDVPYSTALQGKSGNFQPSYDSQKDIYTAILSDLKKATELLEKGGSMAGDIMYDGDNSKWIKLANSLRARYLMRLEKKWSEIGIDGAKELQAIVNSGLIFDSNEDNGAVNYLAGTNRWPQNTGRIGGFDEKRMSATIETVLKDLNDPRMTILFREVDNPESKEYKGIPNGLSEDAASNYNEGAKNQSRLGFRFREEPATVEMMIMHYSELMFILAEAAEKGYVSGNAADYYKKGITANMNYLGVNDVQTYLDQDGVKLTGSSLENIATQKWLAFFMVGNEAWYDFRRTGLPALKPGPNATLDQLPSRAFYPSAEQTLNGDNLKAAIAAQGPDELTTKMWLLK